MRYLGISLRISIILFIIYYSFWEYNIENVLLGILLMITNIVIHYESKKNDK